MNISDLKAVVEIGNTGSLSKAAEKLYMCQPNLSRILKAFEEKVGYKIFTRTARGMIPTAKGSALISYSIDILENIAKLENLNKISHEKSVQLCVCVPRLSFYSEMITEYIAGFEKSTHLEISYEECSARQALNKVSKFKECLGIIGCKDKESEALLNYVNQLNMKSIFLRKFSYSLLMSQYHPLAKQSSVEYTALENCIEITYSDLQLFENSTSKEQRTSQITSPKRCIYVQDRSSVLEMLLSIDNSYIWSTPLSSTFLERYGLIQLPCPQAIYPCHEYLVYYEDKKITKEVQGIIEHLKSRCITGI